VGQRRQRQHHNAEIGRSDIIVEHAGFLQESCLAETNHNTQSFLLGFLFSTIIPKFRQKLKTFLFAEGGKWGLAIDERGEKR
jgi:hypothetical protein